MLQTRFLAASAELTLTDFMLALTRADALRQLPPGHELIRIVAHVIFGMAIGALYRFR